MKFNIDEYGKLLASSINSMPLDLKTKYQYYFTYYGKEIEVLHKKILDELIEHKFSDEIISEIEYLMDFEKSKIIDDIVIPIENYLRTSTKSNQLWFVVFLLHKHIYNLKHIKLLYNRLLQFHYQ